MNKIGEVIYYRSLVSFFSSRRRHTRCSRDWSSDVCSSDLRPAGARHHGAAGHARRRPRVLDRKSTRLNSSHGYISYAVFCLKKTTKTERKNAHTNEAHRATERHYGRAVN